MKNIWRHSEEPLNYQTSFFSSWPVSMSAKTLRVELQNTKYRPGRWPAISRIRSTAHADVTLVCYGGSLAEAEKALDKLFDEHEIVA